MATVPNQATVSAGGTLTAAIWNDDVRDMGNFFISGRPKFEGRQSVAQSMPNATWASITLDVEDHDNDSGHSTVTNTSRYTAVTAGWYQCSGGVTYVNTSLGGDRRARLAVNGTAVNASAGSTTADASVAYSVNTRTKLVFLNVGDYLELQGLQTASSGTLNTHTTVENQSSLTAIWMSS